MANLSHLTQITADEAWEAMLATEAALHHWVESLADGEVTPEEAAEGIQKLEVALKEAREAKVASDITYRHNRAAETIMRASADTLLDEGVQWSDYRLHILGEAGLQVIEEPDNIRRFPARNEDDAA